MLTHQQQALVAGKTQEAIHLLLHDLRRVAREHTCATSSKRTPDFAEVAKYLATDDGIQRKYGKHACDIAKRCIALRNRVAHQAGGLSCRDLENLVKLAESFGLSQQAILIQSWIASVFSPQQAHRSSVQPCHTHLWYRSRTRSRSAWQCVSSRLS
jgi:hypothetical protein